VQPANRGPLLHSDRLAHSLSQLYALEETVGYNVVRNCVVVDCRGFPDSNSSQHLNALLNIYASVDLLLALWWSVGLYLTPCQLLCVVFCVGLYARVDPWLASVCGVLA
jgi:hypothetical protein